jgi:hypothetical protein
LPLPGCSSAWLERLVWDQEAVGSNPITPSTFRYISTGQIYLDFLLPLVATSREHCERFKRRTVSPNWSLRALPKQYLPVPAEIKKFCHFHWFFYQFCVRAVPIKPFNQKKFPFVGWRKGQKLDVIARQYRQSGIYRQFFVCFGALSLTSR